jgi:hypothetical protein
MSGHSSENSFQKEYREFEEKMVKKYRFVIHAICNSEFPYGSNFHTHFLVENFNHPDLQICLPVPDDNVIHTIHDIFHKTVNEIKKGKKFKSGDIVPDIIENYHVLFINAIESRRTILRIIFPDENGNLSKKIMNNFFALQFKNTGYPSFFN